MNSTAIILCTYNGQRYLPEQLDSYRRQTNAQWDLYAYDDGSTDQTESMIDAFAKDNPGHRIHFIRNAEKRGFALNFLCGLCDTPDTYDYYSFSDQDDIWVEDKLKRAVQYLSSLPLHIPAIYGARTTLVDAEGHVLSLSRPFNKPPAFENAVMQSIVGGNTMVMNHAAYELIKRADKNINIKSHDWFLYQLVMGAGGVFHYDATPSLFYRQHGNNLIGSNLGFMARFSRMLNLFNGSFQGWFNSNLDALVKNQYLLTASNQVWLKELIKARTSPWYMRPMLFFKLGIWRQQWMDNVALFFAWCANKI
jgi:glycosyltransferase involved in cell wall biosynthesis